MRDPIKQAVKQTLRLIRADIKEHMAGVIASYRAEGNPQGARDAGAIRRELVALTHPSNFDV